MTTISGHTTRATGTILTASIYNNDHTNHITNANALNSGKIEAPAGPVTDAAIILFDGTDGNVGQDSGVILSDLQENDALLDAIVALATAGLIARTGAGTAAARTITGTANEISVSNGDGAAGNPTLSLPATIDLGGKTSLEIPNDAAPTVNADGEIAVDTTVTDFSHGILKYFSGEEMAVIAVPVAQLTSPSDGDTLAYNATNDEFELVPASGINPVTAQATTSGTAFDFTSIPAGVNRITVMLDGVDLSGTDQYLVQIGDSGGLETSNYLAESFNRSGSANATNGFNMFRNTEDAGAGSGQMILNRIAGTNTWVSSHGLSSSVSGLGCAGGGSKTLSAELDRIRLTRSGTNTFVAGQVAISYEF